jgi:hypothetical protein
MSKSILRLLAVVVTALALTACESRTGEIIETTEAAPTGVAAKPTPSKLDGNFMATPTPAAR